MQSNAAAGTHNGEIYAVIEHPFSVVAQALARPEQWCEVLTLPVNIKRCNASADALSAFLRSAPTNTWR